MRVLPLILARAGSKRLPGKNMLRLGDKTLVEIAMEQALEVFGEAVLSTDSVDILRHITNHPLAGSFKILKRPADLASDSSPSNLSVIHAALRCHIENADMVCLLQPTSPLRTTEDIMAVVANACSGCATFSCTENTVPNGAVYCASVHSWRLWPDSREVWQWVKMPRERSIDINTQEQYEEAVKRWDEWNR